MSGPYAKDRADRPVPGVDVSSITVQQCRIDSRNCGFCGANGWSPIFRFDYAGQVIIDVCEDDRGIKQKLMRSVGYCLCPIGRKMAVTHQRDAKDVFLITPDLHDVIAGRHPEWTEVCPDDRPATEAEMNRLPSGIKAYLERIKTRHYDLER